MESSHSYILYMKMQSLKAAEKSYTKKRIRELQVIVTL